MQLHGLFQTSLGSGGWSSRHGFRATIHDIHGIHQHAPTPPPGGPRPSLVRLQRRPERPPEINQLAAQGGYLYKTGGLPGDDARGPACGHVGARRGVGAVGAIVAAAQPVQSPHRGRVHRATCGPPDDPRRAWSTGAGRGRGRGRALGLGWRGSSRAAGAIRDVPAAARARGARAGAAGRDAGEVGARARCAGAPGPPSCAAVRAQRNLALIPLHVSGAAATTPQLGRSVQPVTSAR